jgi:hypothetical protein
MRTPAVKKLDPGSPVLNSSATRFGVLMGGPKSVEWNMLGEMSIGHQQIDRRDLTVFTNIDVGRRNESEVALNDPNERLHLEWFKNPDRIVTKTARDCANDVRMTYGEIFGFVVPETLIGLAPESAESLFNQVLPADVRSKRLVDVISHLTNSAFEDFQAERLRGELLSGANTCHMNLTQYVTALKTEAGIARDKGTGKKGPDVIEIEYFRELNTPLPEEAPALATLAMGKEIAANIKGGDNSEILKAVLEQNQILMKQFQASQQAPAQEVTTEPAPKKAAGQSKDK